MRATSFHGSRHLGANELVDATGACPVCGGTVVRSSVLTLQKDPTIELLRCPICHACSASRMPTSEVLEQYYGGYYQRDDERITFHGADRFARHVLKAMPDLPTPVRILDFGGGDGSLALAIARRLARPAEVLVVDYESPMPSADSRIQVMHSRELTETTEDWSPVIASGIP